MEKDKRLIYRHTLFQFIVHGIILVLIASTLFIIVLIMNFSSFISEIELAVDNINIIVLIGVALYMCYILWIVLTKQYYNIYLYFYNSIHDIELTERGLSSRNMEEYFKKKPLEHLLNWEDILEIKSTDVIFNLDPFLQRVIIFGKNGKKYNIILIDADPMDSENYYESDDFDKIHKYSCYSMLGIIAGKIGIDKFHGFSKRCQKMIEDSVIPATKYWKDRLEGVDVKSDVYTYFDGRDN